MKSVLLGWEAEAEAAAADADEAVAAAADGAGVEELLAEDGEVCPPDEFRPCCE